MIGRKETIPDCWNDSQPETDTPETGLWIMLKMRCAALCSAEDDER
jgi:hypothetical protein